MKLVNHVNQSHGLKGAFVAEVIRLEVDVIRTIARWRRECVLKLNGLIGHHGVVAAV